MLNSQMLPFPIWTAAAEEWIFRIWKDEMRRIMMLIVSAKKD
ncbi:MAG: hypothetical protein WAQ00_01910 [Tepidanaerobacteraceae bacterium]